MNESTFIKAESIRFKIKRLKEYKKAIIAYNDSLSLSDEEKKEFAQIISDSIAKKINLLNKDFNLL